VCVSIDLRYTNRKRVTVIESSEADDATDYDRQRIARPVTPATFGGRVGNLDGGIDTN